MYLSKAKPGDQYILYGIMRHLARFQERISSATKTTASLGELFEPGVSSTVSFIGFASKRYTKSVRAGCSFQHGEQKNRQDSVDSVRATFAISQRAKFVGRLPKSYT